MKPQYHTVMLHPESDLPIGTVPLDALTRVAEEATNGHSINRHQSHTLIEQGYYAYERGDLVEAIALYRQAIELAPTHRDAYEYLAEALREHGDLAEAEQCYRRAIELATQSHPNGNGNGAIAAHLDMAEATTPEAVLALANAATQAGLWQEAARYYQQALTLLTPNPVASLKSDESNEAPERPKILEQFEDAIDYLGDAEAYLEEGEWGAAIAASEEALERLEPELAQGYRNLAEALRAKGKLDHALLYYQRVLELDPDRAADHVNLGSLYAQQEQWEAAIAHYQQAIELEPSLASAYWNLSQVLERVGQPKQAADALFQAVQLEPTSVSLADQLALAQTLQKQGNTQSALQCYQSIVRHHPTCAQAYNTLGELLYQMGHHATAIAHLRRAVRHDSQNALYFKSLGKALAAQGKWEDAALCLRQVARLEPNTIQPYLTLAQLLEQQRQWGQVAACYRKVADLDPSYWQASYKLAELLLKQQQWADAVEVLNQAIAISPDISWLHHSLGDGLSKLHRRPEAAIAYRRAIELKPDFHWSHNNLADVLIAQGQWQEAYNEIIRGLSHCPQHPDLIKKQIEILVHLGNVDLAEQLSRTTLAQNPLEAKIRVELANILLARNEQHSAYLLLWEGLGQDLHNSLLQREIAKIEKAKGNLAEARRLINQAVALNPHDVSLLLEKIWILWEQGDLAAAEALLRETLSQYPDHPDYLREFVRFTYHKIVRESPNVVPQAALDEFLVPYRRLLRPGAPLYELHFYAADLLKRSGNDQGARQYFKAGIDEYASRPGDLLAAAHHVLAPHGKLLLRDGLSETETSQLLTAWGNHNAATHRPIDAIACYQLAQKFAPKNLVASFNLGVKHLEYGEIFEAIHCFSPLHRVYQEATQSMLWPSTEGYSWPQKPLKLADAFNALKGPNIAWPKITVVTPSYNQGAYIEETLLSVLNQGYENLEFIVVDAVSTDNTGEVLERYRDRLTELIIEPDRGQTDAINKGLGRATGDLLTWVNSDDMLFPGALHMAALAYLKRDCDLVAGACITHQSKSMKLYNRPAVRQHDFTAEGMADLFNRWFKGHYFYQPEVIFSRRIWEKIGGQLNEQLHYTMDYDLWMRFATHGARLEVISWPMALFRQHAQQKTADLKPCLREQLIVRSQYFKASPSLDVEMGLARRLQAFSAMQTKHVLVVSTRADRIFSAHTHADLVERLSASGCQIAFTKDVDTVDAAAFDLVIILVHLQNEPDMIRSLRDRGFKGIVIGWFWDNHHHLEENARIAEHLDVAIAGHQFAQDVLRTSKSVFGGHIPLCTTQWAAQEAQTFFKKYGYQDRSNQLYGGFTRYDFAQKRNRLLDDITANMPDAAITLFTEANQDVYFGLSPEQRFAQWASYKTSLCLPLDDDLSQRLFDALLCGQIPIVSNDILDLDLIISPELQEQLPIIKINSYSVEEVQQAHQKAIETFDQQGLEGVKNRHQFVLENHLFASRVQALIESGSF